MSGYVTAQQIREQCIAELRNHVAHEESMAAECAKQSKPFVRRYSLAVIGTPAYEKWLTARVEDFRRKGKLVTEQQLVDIRAGRRFEEEDRARYIGETRLEDCGERGYTRTQGQTGFICDVSTSANGKRLVTFMPDVDPNLRAPEGPTVLVAQLRVAEGTPAYFDLERIPAQQQGQA